MDKNKEIYQRFDYQKDKRGIYWNKKEEKELLKSIGQLPDEKEVRKDIPLLGKLDVLGDQLVEELFLKKGYHAGMRIFNEASQNPLNKTDNGALNNLLNQVTTIPNWVNQDKLNRGADFCRMSGPPGFLVLRNYCLMGGYQSSAINKALIATGALKKGAAKRTADTLDFWIKVTRKNALQLGGIGFQSILKTRLHHSYARVSILKKSDWETNKWGLPLNQWDMLATNLIFSSLFMDGLKKFACTVSEEDYDAVLHLWKYIGYLLGINPDILPNNRVEANSALYKWSSSQPDIDADTIALAKSLYLEPLTAVYPKTKFRKAFSMQYHLGLNYFFLGSERCKKMQLPNTMFRLFPYLNLFLNKLVNYYAAIGVKQKEQMINWGGAQQEKFAAAYFPERHKKSS